MRWLLIDRFVELVSGERASAIKSVVAGEDYLEHHFPGYPVFPPTLMIEGMAQTAGILVGEARNFGENVVLAKIRSATFDAYASPGDLIRYDAKIENLDERGALTSGTIRKNDTPIGTVDLMFSHVSLEDLGLDFPERNFVFGDNLQTMLANVEGLKSRLGGTLE